MTKPSLSGRAVALFIASCLAAPGGTALAQGAVETSEVTASFVRGSVDTPLRLAAFRAGGRLAQSAATVPPNPESRASSSHRRHPVLVGTLIGGGAGIVLAQTRTFGGNRHDPKVALLGAGIGAWGGLVVSAFQTARLKYEPSASGEPDALAVKRMIEKLGVGQQIVMTGVDSRVTIGTIQVIGLDAFEVLPANQSRAAQVSYSSVRAVRAKPLGRGARIGIAAGAIGAVVLPILACFGAGGCGGTS